MKRHIWKRGQAAWMRERPTFAARDAVEAEMRRELELIVAGKLTPPQSLSSIRREES